MPRPTPRIRPARSLPATNPQPHASTPSLEIRLTGGMLLDFLPLTLWHATIFPILQSVTFREPEPHTCTDPGSKLLPKGRSLNPILASLFSSLLLLFLLVP